MVFYQLSFLLLRVTVEHTPDTFSLLSLITQLTLLLGGQSSSNKQTSVIKVTTIIVLYFDHGKKAPESLLIHSKYKAHPLSPSSTAAKIVFKSHLSPVTLVLRNPCWPAALGLCPELSRHCTASGASVLLELPKAFQVLKAI